MTIRDRRFIHFLVLVAFPSFFWGIGIDARALSASPKKVTALLRLEARYAVSAAFGRVDHKDARYPVAVDPYVEQARLWVPYWGNAFGFQLGWSVSLSEDGNTALVGSPQWEISYGAAYVFIRSGRAWKEQAELKASDNAWGDKFGISVALSPDGNTALIGTDTATVGENIYQGAAYVFTRSGITWSQQAKLTASDGAYNDRFGGSLSLSPDGNTALIGAPRADGDGKTDQGAAYVFSRSGSSWAQQFKLISDGLAFDCSGNSVSLSEDGNTALVGAIKAEVNGIYNWGAAYVFTRSGSSWSQQARLTSSDGAQDDQFGISVSLNSSGTAALVGADCAVVGGNEHQGAAYVFTLSGNTWSQQAKLIAPDGAGNDYFGTSLSLSDDSNIALIGAPNADVGGAADQGTAYVFTRAESTWSLQSKLVPTSGGAYYYFGRSVSLSNNGKTLLVGEYGYNMNWGTAYVFQIYPYDDAKEDLLGTWDGQGVYFRNSLTGSFKKLSSPADLIASGDLDHEGKDDLIGIWPGQGGVWVRYSYTGAWAKLSSTARHISSGDMNGDQRDDFLGTWDGQGVFYKDSKTGAWVKIASPATLIAAGQLDQYFAEDLIGIWPEQSGVWVRYSPPQGTWARLASIARDIASGDMNGDGRDDLLGTWDGQGVFYRDSETGAWVKMSTPAEQVTTGDLDGDGTDDLVGQYASQGGVWVKYSKTGAWSKLSTPAKDIAAGLMRKAVWAANKSDFVDLIGPFGGFAEGPGAQGNFKDMSETGPGGWRFSYQEEKNLIPKKPEKAQVIPGPGDPGFTWIEQKNLVPQERLELKQPKGSDKRTRKKEIK